MPPTNATPRYNPRWTSSSSPASTSSRPGVFHEQGSFLSYWCGQGRGRHPPSLPNARLMTTRHFYPRPTPVFSPLSTTRRLRWRLIWCFWFVGSLSSHCLADFRSDGRQFGWCLVFARAERFFPSYCTSLRAWKPMDARHPCEQTPQERTTSR